MVTERRAGPQTKRPVVAARLAMAALALALLAGCAAGPPPAPAGGPPAGLAAIAPEAGVVATRPDILRMQWDRTRVRAQAAAQPTRCEALFADGVPQPVPVVDPPVFFTSLREVDPNRLASYRAATETARSFKAFLVTNANAHVRSRPENRTAARCLLDGLDEWARGGGLLGSADSPQSEHERAFLLAAIASSYAPIARVEQLDPVKQARVEAWITKLAYRVAIFYDPETSRFRNNLAYWAGYAVSLAGAALNDHRLFEFGIAWYREALRQIADDGSLPHEVERGPYALGYHAFALNPLVLIAELGEANGVPLYAERGYRISLLADFLLKALKDPAPLARLAGAEQDQSKRGCDWYVWMEPYLARFEDWRLRPYVEACRGRFQRFDLVVDVTALYGDPEATAGF